MSDLPNGQFVGEFDTGRPCVCRMANVIDHARHKNPALDQYRIVHEYWCNACGCVYSGTVIEKTYVPKEKESPAA